MDKKEVKDTLLRRREWLTDPPPDEAKAVEEAQKDPALAQFARERAVFDLSVVQHRAHDLHLHDAPGVERLMRMPEIDLAGGEVEHGRTDPALSRGHVRPELRPKRMAVRRGGRYRGRRRGDECEDADDGETDVSSAQESLRCAASRARFSISSGGTSSTWVAIHHRFPTESRTPPERSP